MKTILFLDDWLLESHVDIVRRWHAGTPLPVEDPPTLPARSTVVLDSTRGIFMAWSKALGTKRASLLESEDGLQWHEAGAGMTVHESVNFPFEATLSFDPLDQDAARRFKMTLFPYPRGVFGGPGVLSFSADGRRWKTNRRCRWYTRTNGSDTIHPMFYNPFIRRWCVICRPWCADRRVALVESEDLQHWAEPRVIVHPDVADPAGTQFYGMSATRYEDDYFVGGLHVQRAPMSERFVNDRQYKNQGSVEGQLTYSYDGRLWMRSDRSALIPRTDPGQPGSGCVYPHAIIAHPDPRQGILLYSLGTFNDHGAFGDPDAVKGPPPGYSCAEYMLVHRLRRDGFVSLEAAGGTGQLTTRGLIPRAPQLALNYLAPVGRVLVQVTDMNERPLPGYRFEECLPLRGDELQGVVRWKRKRDLADLIGTPIRLQIRLLDARLYAIRLDCGLWYAYLPAALDRIP